MSGGSNRRCFACASAALALLLACAGRAPSADPFDLHEGWSGTGVAAWTNATQTASLDNPGGCLRLRHPAQSRPAFGEDTARLFIAPGVRLTNISLRFSSGITVPSSLRLCLHAPLSGRLWYMPLSTPPAGQTQDYSVPVTSAPGAWRTGPNSPVEQFESDVALADWVGVAVVRNADPAAQDYAIDEVWLRGVYTADVDGDGIPNQWEMTYGLDPAIAADGAADPDGDRMSNYAEYRAGTRPQDAASRFVVRISGTNAPGQGPRAALRWPSISNRTYAVWAAESPDAAFERIEGGLPATPSTNTFVDRDSTAAGPKYYRIEVEGL